ALQGEKNGALLDADELAKLLENPRVLGLGEVMDCQAVLEGQPDMMKKLSLFQGRVMDGHIIGLSPQEVTAYALSGIKTNHEAMTYEEAAHQVANGMYVLIRDGSAVHNVEAIVSGLVAHKAPLDRYAFCSDDKHIEDIKQEGHISANVRQAIELGLSPIQAFKMASTHACQCFGLSHLGALAPGYQADFLILDDIEQVSIEAVYVKGRALHNEVLEIEEEDRQWVPQELLHTVNMAPVALQDLALPVLGLMPVINLVPGQITTIKSLESVPTQDGYFQAEEGFNKIACIERHEATGHCGIGIVKGFGLQAGAIATTFAHDSHNVVVIGDNDQDMLCAIERLKVLGGGYVIASQGVIKDELPLEIMGLMTHCHHAVVDAKVKDMKALAYDMGVPRELDPFINLSFLALPVIPEIRISPLGVVDVN
ncbi:MAG: adenine deaminase, partial [Veillonella sp.]|nr:adenine deaminase [Veillonella sp.]